MTRLIDADALNEEIRKQYRHFGQRIAISLVFEAIKKSTDRRCDSCPMDKSLGLPI